RELFGAGAEQARRRDRRSLWKSGLQKAVRRGDAALAIRCFSALWNDPEGRDAVLRRLPIIAVEEQWRATAEVTGAVGLRGRLLTKGVVPDAVGDLLAREVARL